MLPSSDRDRILNFFGLFLPLANASRRKLQGYSADPRILRCAVMFRGFKRLDSHTLWFIQHEYVGQESAFHRLSLW